jgi:hypothetical protein
MIHTAAWINVFMCIIALTADSSAQRHLSVSDVTKVAHPHIGIGGEFKNRACNLQTKAEICTRICNSPPIPM